MTDPPTVNDQPSRPNRRRIWFWRILGVAAFLLVAALLRSPSRLDPRLVGEWQFLTIDGTNIARFLTLNPDGTATFEELRPGAAERNPVTRRLNWWVEGDVLVTEVIENPPTRVQYFVHDLIRSLRLQKREDRSIFRVKFTPIDSKTMKIVEVTAAVADAPTIEMTRVEKPAAF